MSRLPRPKICALVRELQGGAPIVRLGLGLAVLGLGLQFQVSRERVAVLVDEARCRALAQPQVHQLAIGVERLSAGRIVDTRDFGITVQGAPPVEPVERVGRQLQALRQLVAPGDVDQVHQVLGLIREGVDGASIPRQEALGRQAVADELVVGVPEAQVRGGPRRFPSDLGEELAQLARRLVAPAVLVQRPERDEPVEGTTEPAMFRFHGPPAERSPTTSRLVPGKSRPFLVRTARAPPSVLRPKIGFEPGMMSIPEMAGRE